MLKYIFINSQCVKVHFTLFLVISSLTLLVIHSFFGFQHIQHRLLIRRSFLFCICIFTSSNSGRYTFSSFSFSLRSDLHPTDIFHTSLPGNSRQILSPYRSFSISAQSEAPPDQNHHDNKNYDFPLENPAEEVLQVLAVHFRRLLHSPGILQNRKYCRIFKR